MSEWGFYGRRAEIGQLRDVLSRGRWFFAKLTGRRRIGKTALIQHAFQVHAADRQVLYVQIPDSGAVGVLSTFADAMDTFDIDTTRFPKPKSLVELSSLIGELARAGFIVALDEFQYFNRKRLQEFCSHLQREVDSLSQNAGAVPGGLIVLGSIHTEMSALLEDRNAPLFNRVTDEIALTHLDIRSLMELLSEHTEPTPERLLFLWTLFEGVPKFYRDCFEQGVLNASREELLMKAFFRSSSPLRTEADNWFLKELHGRYDVVLKYIARNSGCSHRELVAHVENVGGQKKEQVGGYLQTMINKYGLIEKKLPVFASPKSRKNRYYIGDNFLRAWLAALSNEVSAINFRPVDDLVRRANEKLYPVEGVAFEKLVAQLYEERSRMGVGDFQLTERISGYWNRSDTEIDLVALDAEAKIIRFGTCKRSAKKLIADIENFDGHIQRFLKNNKKQNSWRIERVALAPQLSSDDRAFLNSTGCIPQDLNDLIKPLLK